MMHIILSKKLKDYFTRDLKPRQKKYEALRAVAFRDCSI